MKEATEEFEWVQVTSPVALAIMISVAGSLIPGIVPSFILEYAQMAVKLL